MTRIHIKLLFSGLLRVKRRAMLQWLTILVAFWPVLIKPVSVLPGLLSYLKYLPDGILFGMLVLCLGRKKITVRKDYMALLQTTIGFLSYCVVVYLFQYQSAAYFLWGFRNNFRFYLAFFAFIAYLDETDVDTWFKAMDILFWINIALSVLQFFLLGIKGDYLGGIFGIQGASNAYTMYLMSIVVCKSLLDTFSQKERFSNSMAKCVASICIAAMAEMKFYYFIFVFLLVGSVFLTRFSVKKIMYLLTAMMAVMLGAMLLVEWFDFRGFFSIEGFLEEVTRERYASQRDISRFSAIPMLCKNIVKNPLEMLFGMGLGNCDTSSFAICNTPFFQRYGYLHYYWFVSAMIFLETGFLGLGIYISFFVICFCRAYRFFKQKKGNLVHLQLCILLSLLCVALTVYDSALRSEAGYMMYFVLALPFIGKKHKE